MTGLAVYIYKVRDVFFLIQGNFHDFTDFVTYSILKCNRAQISLFERRGKDNCYS
jgi:hypothetical protein